MLEKLPKLGEFQVEIIQGATRYGEKRHFTSSGLPFISAKVVTPLGIDLSKDEKYIQAGSEMDYKRARLELEDVVFVRVGVGCIGRTAVVTKESEKGLADDWIYIIRNKDSRLSPYFLALWFQTSIMQKEIKRLARGVGTLTIPIGLVKELPILLCDKQIIEKCKDKYTEIVSAKDKGLYQKAEAIKKQICTELENKFLEVSRNLTGELEGK